MTIPNAEILGKLSKAFGDVFKTRDIPPITVVFNVDQSTLNKVNEDFFYRNKLNENGYEIKEVDEVVVSIDNIKFVYKKNEE